MRKLLMALVLGALLGTTLLGLSQAQAHWRNGVRVETPPTLAVEATDPGPGAGGIGRLYVDNIRGLMSWTIDVEYDSSVITIEQCAITIQVSDCDPNFEVGTLRDDGEHWVSISGERTLATFIFECSADGGSTDLTIDVVRLDDRRGDPVEATVVDDTIDCDTPADVG